MSQVRIHRQHDWRSRLHRYAGERVGQSFQWGESDCGTLARNALAELFGRDVMPILPRWHSAREALAILETHGTFGQILTALDPLVTTPAFMRSGDLLVCEEPDEEVGRESLLVCLDGRQCLSSGKEGVFTMTLTVEEARLTVYSLWEVSVDG